MIEIQTASLIIVVAMLLLMTTGMPLGIVTLTVSIGTDDRPTSPANADQVPSGY